MQAWGLVTQLSPLQVRFAGDTADVDVNQNPDVTLATGDRVALFRFGNQWYVGFVLKAG